MENYLYHGSRTSGIEIYNGERLIKSYNVPMNEKGTRWNVFEIMDGKIVDTNTIS